MVRPSFVFAAGVVMGCPPRSAAIMQFTCKMCVKMAYAWIHSIAALGHSAQRKIDPAGEFFAQGLRMLAG